MVSKTEFSMSYCLVANAFCDGLILHFAWVRLEGGLKGEKNGSLFLSPQSFLPYHIFSLKSLNWFLPKGPVVVGNVFVAAELILLMARRETSYSG